MTTKNTFNFNAYATSEERTNKVVYTNLITAPIGSYNLILEDITDKGFLFSNESYKYNVEFKSAAHADIFMDQLVLQNDLRSWGQVSIGCTITLYVTPWTRDDGSLGKSISPYKPAEEITQSNEEEIL